jgi:hypothetical protein
MRSILFHLFAILVMAIVANVTSAVSSVNVLIYLMSKATNAPIPMAMAVTGSPSVAHITIFPAFVT